MDDFNKKLINKIITKRFTEKKSYRTIGGEVDRSRTFVMHVIKEHYIVHPELKPVIVAKPPKKIIKGHIKTTGSITADIAPIQVDGYAARIIKRFTNCGIPTCDKCRRDDNNQYVGHGPYSYLSYRDKSGSVVTKYLNKTELKKLIAAIATYPAPVKITIHESRILILGVQK